MIQVQDKVWEDLEALKMMTKTFKSLGMDMEFNIGQMELITKANGT